MPTMPTIVSPVGPLFGVKLPATSEPVLNVSLFRSMVTVCPSRVASFRARVAVRVADSIKEDMVMVFVVRAVLDWVSTDGFMVTVKFG